jgi:hypothetical protein
MWLRASRARIAKRELSASRQLTAMRSSSESQRRAS